MSNSLICGCHLVFLEYVLKSRSLRLAEHVAQIPETRSADAPLAHIDDERGG